MLGDNAAMQAAAPSLPGLRQRALEALALRDPSAKVAAVLALNAGNADLPLNAGLHLVAPQGLPGRPDKPELIHPAQVAKRSPASQEGRAALLHAIAHIEFNAINLALDAVWRFSDMPEDFYLDWLRVAKEEAHHFTLLRDHLATLGHAYGDYPAHDNLWMMCERTQDNVLARMALVPRTLEARGLDATPLIQAKLRQVGALDALRAVDILEIILRDEVGHVAIGNHWYRWLCERHGLEPVAHYRVLARQYEAPRLHPPYNEEARRRAGFSDEELQALKAGAAQLAADTAAR